MQHLVSILCRAPSSNQILLATAICSSKPLLRTPTAFATPRRRIPTADSTILLPQTLRNPNPSCLHRCGHRRGSRQSWPHLPSRPNNPGSGDGCGGNGGAGGSGSDRDDIFWSRLFSPRAANVKEQSSGGPEWDSHGLPANIIVRLHNFSSMKHYKISEILFFGRRHGTSSSNTEDSFIEMVSLRAGGVYTKLQLQKELESLASCDMFEKLDFDSKTKPDGTLALTVYETESTW